MEIKLLRYLSLSLRSYGKEEFHLRFCFFLRLLSFRKWSVSFAFCTVCILVISNRRQLAQTATVCSSATAIKSMVVENATPRDSGTIYQ